MTADRSVKQRTRMVCHIVTGLDDGGAEGVLFRLCANDHSVTHVVISLMGDGKYGALLRAIGVEVVTLDMPRGRITWAGIARLWRTLRDARPCVVQTWMYHADVVGGLVARLARSGRVFWGIRNSTLSPLHTARRTRVMVRVAAVLSHAVPDAIVSCSQRAAEVHMAKGYPSKLFTVIPNGVDTVAFAPDEQARRSVRTELGISESTTIIGMVARFDPQKDHQTLLRAVNVVTSRQSDVQLLLVGTGMTTSNDQLAMIIDENGMRNHTILAGQRNDIDAIMNAIDVHVLTSAYGEAFPNVVAEAMACGTPCVVSDVGDAALIVGSNGWVVPPNNPGQFADALSQARTVLTEDPKQWERLCRSARDRITAEFRIDLMIDGYHRVWGI